LKVILIIQARCASSRLPNKVLTPIGKKPLLSYIIDFIKFSKLIDEIIVATTTNNEDDEIEKLCQKKNVECFRGSDLDALDRYYECAKFYKGDIVVRMTGDNPLVDPNIIDNIIKIFKENNYDYVSNTIQKTFPIGFSSCEVFTFSILKKLHENQKDPMSREHITWHIRKNPHLYRIKEFLAPEHLQRPLWRLTVDYKEDLDLMSEIFLRLYKPNSYIRYEDVVELLDKNNNLLIINKKHY